MRPPNPIGNLSVRTSGKIPDDDLLPEGWEDDLLAGAPGAAPMDPAPTPSLPPVQSRRAPPSPAPAPEPAAMLQAATISDDTALLAAFLAGAGLPDAKPADPLVTMRRLGETYRALVSGLRSVLIARASIKSEFRIEQTLIQTRGNNPLKFSANDDDAVSALLGVGRHSGMAPDKAVTEALRDIRLHELASMAAMQAAVRALLQSVAPATVRGSVEQGGGMSLLPNQKKARAWDTYEALHDRVTQALSDDFDSVFGKAFARAYEETLDDLTARDRP
jgi:type VI secretion system FHA domain protein